MHTGLRPCYHIPPVAATQSYVVQQPKPSAIAENHSNPTTAAPAATNKRNIPLNHASPARVHASSSNPPPANPSASNASQEPVEAINN
jgi:hypothetical protein